MKRPPVDLDYQPPGEAVRAGEGPKEKRQVKFKTLADFIGEFRPISYRVEPILRSSSLYTLTAKTGAGKTALLTIMALAIATGRKDILGMEVERGRTAYCCFENPDDVRMRFMLACYHCSVDAAEIVDDIVFIDMRETPESLLDGIRVASKKEPFAAVIIDTFAAAFDGKDVNDNVATGEFMRRLRPITQLPGLTTVIVAAHPVKGATTENLVPYGGGAILNEVDGNLVLKKNTDTGLVELHWQGKFRGLEFKPLLFRFDILSTPDVKDSKGREVELPLLRPTTEEDSEAREKAAVSEDHLIINAINEAPGGTIRQWAAKTGLHRSAVGRRLKAFEKAKLVEKTLHKWTLTPKGRAAKNEPPNESSRPKIRGRNFP
jgi:hypothetical protein